MTIRIEVAYALPERQEIVTIEVDETCDISEAIQVSGILQKFPEIDPEKDAVGIFGQLVPRTYSLREGDRIEIYRPLNADPRIARRERSKTGTIR